MRRSNCANSLKIAEFGVSVKQKSVQALGDDILYRQNSAGRIAHLSEGRRGTRELRWSGMWASPLGIRIKADLMAKASFFSSP
jgi:hypothetical protein